MNKIQRLISFLFMGFIVFVSFDETNATLYYNNYFDNTRIKEAFGGDYDLAYRCWGIATVKMKDDPNRDTPPTAFGIDAGYNRIVWNWYNPSEQTWNLYSYGNFGVTDGEFSFPQGITANSNGDVYVSDTVNNRIVKLKYNILVPSMTFITNFGMGQLNNPQQVALDKSDNVYVCDSGNNRICKFNSNGVLLQTIGSVGSGDGQFQNPMGVTVSIADGSIYVADTGNGRIQKFDSNGNFLKEFRRSEEQPITATYFSMDTDLFGNVYAVDSINNLVYKFDPDLEYITSTSGRPDSPFTNLHGISCDKSYDASGTWFSSGDAFTIENTRGQYFNIGMDVVNVSVSNSPFYPKGFEKVVTTLQYRLAETGYVVINVKDETGNGLIRNLLTSELQSIGSHSTIWDGKDNAGNVVAEGNYSFEIIAHDLYNEGRGNKQVFKYVPVEVVLPPSVSIKSISPTTVISGQTTKINYSISRDANVTIKVYRGNEIFDDRTKVRTVIEDVSRKYTGINYTGINEEVWDILDDTHTNYVVDGVYTVEIYAEDFAGRSDPTRAPPIKVDRTPSYVTNIFCEPFIFKPQEGINTVLNYTLSDKADVLIELLNVAEEVILREQIVSKEKGTNTYQWDGKINGNLVDDGSYIFKITTFDEVGNKAEGSASTIKNRIPTVITFPTKDLEKVFDTIIIKGTAVDPNLNNGEDFDNYKLYYAAGNIIISNPTQIPLFNNLNIWKPIPVPTSNQSSTDPNYPNSNVSYRSVINTTLAEWDTTGISDGTYTILLVSSDKAGNVFGATRVVEVANAGAIVTTPRITIDSYPSEFKPSGNNYAFIVYTLANKQSNVTMEIYNLGQSPNSGTVPIILHREYLNTGIGQHAIAWDGRNYLDKLIETGVYRVKFTAKSIDGTGVSSAYVDISVTVYTVLGGTLTATPNIFKPDGTQSTTISWTLSKDAKIKLGIYQDAISETPLETFIDDGASGRFTLAGTHSISWNGMDLSAGGYVIKLFANATDSYDPSYGNNPSVVAIAPIGTTYYAGTATAEIQTPIENEIVKGNANFTWKANGTGNFYPPQKFNATITANGTKYNYYPQGFNWRVTANGTRTWTTTENVKAAHTGEGTDPESGIKYGDAHLQPNYSQNIEVHWDNAVNSSSAVYHRGNQLRWYGTGINIIPDYIWIDATGRADEIGVVAWGGHHWLWGNLEGAIQVYWQHRWTENYTATTGGNNTVNSNEIRTIGYSVSIPQGTVTDANLWKDNPNVEIIGFTKNFAGNTVYGTITIKNIIPPEITPWSASITLENKICSYGYPYISSDLNQMLAVPPATNTEEIILSSIEPYTISGITNQNVAGTIIKENNVYRFKAETNVVQDWTTAEDDALKEFSGSIREMNAEFNNDEISYKYITSSLPKIISNYYPLGKQVLGMDDPNRNKYTYVSKDIYNDEFESPVLDRSKWQIIRENSINWSLESGRFRLTTEYGELGGTINNNKNTLLETAPLGDFSIITRLEYESKSYNEGAGIIIYRDDDNYVNLRFMGGSNPISYWNFDEGTGNVAKDSAGMNNGEIHGATWVDGRFGKALNFDGVDDYIDIPGGSFNFNRTDNYSLEFWFKTTFIDSNWRTPIVKRVTGGAHPFGSEIEPNTGKVQCTTYSGGDWWGKQSSTSVVDGNWHHVVMVHYSNSTFDAFLDGVELTVNVGSKSFPETGSTANSENLRIGSDTSLGRYFNGTIDGVAIYNRALSDAEIIERYNNNRIAQRRIEMVSEVGASQLIKSVDISFLTSAYLKLAKSGTNYTGYYSSDGTNWSEIGSFSNTEAVPQPASFSFFNSIFSTFIIF